MRDGKGGRDRMTLLPQSLVAGLQDHLLQVRIVHQTDMAAGSQVSESAAIPFVIPSGSATLAFGQVRQHTCWNGDRTSGLSRSCWAIGT